MTPRQRAAREQAATWIDAARYALRDEPAHLRRPYKVFIDAQRLAESQTAVNLAACSSNDVIGISYAMRHADAAQLLRDRARRSLDWTRA